MNPGVTFSTLSFVLWRVSVLLYRRHSRLVHDVCVPCAPDAYSQAMDRYFMTVPDKWTNFAIGSLIPRLEG